MPGSAVRTRAALLVLLAAGIAVVVAVALAARVGEPSAEPSPQQQVIRVAAVGDMNPGDNTDPASSSGRTAADISDFGPDIFFALGDFQYPVGNCAELVSYWDELWGSLVPVMFHIAGPTHDWASATDELGYRDHTNGACPDQDTGPSRLVSELGHSLGPGELWSRDVGGWHIVGLPTGLWRYDEQRAEAMTAELAADLAAARERGKFLLVAYHDPYFTSTTDAHTRELELKPWIDVMDRYGVRVTLSASQHNYERSCPVLPDDSCTAEAGRGVTAFQVSTGGTGMREFVDAQPAFIDERFSGTYGWLELLLEPGGGFSWTFHPVDGPRNTDSGSRPGLRR